MYKIIESGRSMIEMLGVLAIVGVLSVGGIAGYSKAIRKFKDNKQIEQISMLLYNTIDIQTYLTDMVRKNPQSAFSIVNVLNSIDRIPEGMKVEDKILHDIYGNTLWSFYGLGYCLKSDGTSVRCSKPESYFSIILNHNDTKFSRNTENQCKNLVAAISPFSENIKGLEFRNNKNGSSTGAGYEVSNIIFGKKGCDSKKLCFDNLSPVQLDVFCKSCHTKSCGFILHLDLF